METELIKRLKKAEKPIVLYGMGNGAEKILDMLNDFGIKVSGIFASDGFAKHKLFRGFIVESYDEIKSKFPNMIVLVSFGSSLPSVISNIKKIATEQELYAPDVAVYGDGLFNEEYIKVNKERIKWLYSHLADDISKHTFECILNYRVSGKIEYLFECEKSQEEAYESFLKFGGNETFVDLGAYNGDTAADFIRHVPSYSKIYAVEPDKRSFKKLIENTKDFENIECVNACISDMVGTKEFAMRGGRNSSVGKGNLIRATTVDELLQGLPATFIKYDVEGEEAAAILGSKNTILSHKPRLQIAAYHRTDDLLSLPEQILKIRDDYKVYLRHNPYIPAWDTNFFFI